MPSRKDWIVEPFLDLPPQCEIVGIHRVRRSNVAFSEIEIEVLLASELDEQNFDPDRHCFIRWVGCGQLDLLEVGSIWTAGRRVGYRRCATYTASASFLRPGELGIAGPPSHNRPCPTDAISSARTFCLVCEQGNGPECPVKFPVVPQFELARALFGVSTSFIHEMIDGVRDNSIVKGRGAVITACLSQCDPRKVQIVARRKLTDAEAVLVALLATDKRIRSAYDGVFQGLSVSEKWRSGAARLGFIWPFSYPIGLRFQGRWVDRGQVGAATPAKRLFLVTRILEIKLKFGFDQIEIVCPGPRLKSGQPSLPAGSARYIINRNESVLLRTGAIGSTARSVSIISASEATLAGADHVDIRHLTYGDSEAPTAGPMGGEEDDSILGSTADPGGYAHRAIGRAIVRRQTVEADEELRKDRASSLLRTWEALNTAAEEEGWQRRRWALRNRTIVPCGDTPDFRAESIIVEVQAGDVWIMILDSGTTSIGQRSLGMVRLLDGAQFSSEQVRKLSFFTASFEGQWGKRAAAKELLAFGMKLHSHRRPPNVWKNPVDYVRLIKFWANKIAAG